jgi:hypothetical protein
MARLSASLWASLYIPTGGKTSEFGVRRIFLGRKSSGETAATLADSKGKERIRMVIGADDVPRLEFLDGEGDLQPAAGLVHSEALSTKIVYTGLVHML